VRIAHNFTWHLAKQVPKPAIENGKVYLTITYCPPDRRRRDRDNAEAAGKAARDGLADAWGIDDQHFVITSEWGESCDGGAMIVTFEPEVL
jgi:crossover junction endodeoxyribonuclease RusA